MLECVQRGKRLKVLKGGCPSSYQLSEKWLGLGLHVGGLFRADRRMADRDVENCQPRGGLG